MINMEKLKAQIDEDKILKKLQEEYAEYIENLNFNEFNVGDRARENAYMVEHFRLLAISEKNKLKRIEEQINTKAGELYNHYKYEDDRELSKVEIERYYLPTNGELNRLKRLYAMQEVKVGFFDVMAESFKSQGFSIKNFLDNLKIGG